MKLTKFYLYNKPKSYDSYSSAETWKNAVKTTTNMKTWPLFLHYHGAYRQKEIALPWSVSTMNQPPQPPFLQSIDVHWNFSEKKQNSPSKRRSLRYFRIFLVKLCQQLTKKNLCEKKNWLRILKADVEIKSLWPICSNHLFFFFLN